MEGAAPPTLVSINEWDSLEHAIAFYESADHKTHLPQNKGKVFRRYAVEAVE